MARILKALPAEMYVAEVTIDYISWGGRECHAVELLGPYATLAVAKGQASGKAYWTSNNSRTITAKFFKGKMTWEEL